LLSLRATVLMCISCDNQSRNRKIAKVLRILSKSPKWSGTPRNLGISPPAAIMRDDSFHLVECITAITGGEYKCCP
jgi:hypothetical protein